MEGKEWAVLLKCKEGAREGQTGGGDYNRGSKGWTSKAGCTAPPQVGDTTQTEVFKDTLVENLDSWHAAVHGVAKNWT